MRWSGRACTGRSREGTPTVHQEEAIQQGICTLLVPRVGIPAPSLLLFFTVLRGLEEPQSLFLNSSETVLRGLEEPHNLLSTVLRGLEEPHNHSFTVLRGLEEPHNIFYSSERFRGASYPILQF